MSKPATKGLDRLFVYGIFLGLDNRLAYGMSNPKYAVVPDYVTARVGGSIVEAVPVDSALDLALTGLLVDVDPTCWGRIDALESGYDRIKVITEERVLAWMYVSQDY